MNVRRWIRNLFYDGAKQDRLGGGWRPATGRGAEEVDKPSRFLLLERARDLERNSDIVESAIGAISRNAIGANGIIPQAHVLKANGDEDERRNDAIEALWREWCRHEYCDVAGAQTFAELQSLVLRRRIVDGEVFVRKIYVKGRFPLRLQVLEPDQLDKSKTEHQGRKVYEGIEVDEYLRPVAYWFLPDPLKDPIRVPAEEVIHLWHRKRPTQVHGVSELAIVMQRIKDTKEFIDAELVAARIAACFALFVRTPNPGGFTGRMDKNSANQPLQSIEPGMIQYLGMGEDVVEAKPNHPSTTARDFVSLQQRLSGAGLGMSYESLSRDLSQVSYSSVRQGHLEDRKNYEIFQRYLVEHFCRPVWEAFVESVALSGALKIPDFYGRRERYVSARWITPGWQWVDPLKEVNAATQSLLIGASTLEEICGGKGADWQEVLRQRAREQKYAADLGLTLGGSPPEPTPPDEKEE
jgi:lambda family phage portal protein